MRFFPLFYNLYHKPVLVVGGGEVACRKVESLLKADAFVTLVSPSLEPFLERLYEEGKITWIKGFYKQALIDEFVQVWATTDNPELNHKVHDDAKRAGIMVNVVDDPLYCDFITPSMINRGRIQVAFSSGGASPVLIRNLRRTFEAVLPQNLSLLADFGALKRFEIKQKLSDVTRRRLFWEHFFELNSVKQADSLEQLHEIYDQEIASQDFSPRFSVVWIETGKDFELLTLRSLRLMQSAEIVLHHSRVDEVFVDSCRRDAERTEWASVALLSELIGEEERKCSSVVVLLPKMNSALKSEIELALGIGITAD